MSLIPYTGQEDKNINAFIIGGQATGGFDIPFIGTVKGGVSVAAGIGFVPSDHLSALFGVSQVNEVGAQCAVCTKTFLGKRGQKFCETCEPKVNLMREALK